MEIGDVIAHKFNKIDLLQEALDDDRVRAIERSGVSMSLTKTYWR